MIHKYKLAGYNIVLDVNSGGVHVVDDLTYDILDNIEPPFAEKCPENVIEKLSKFHRKEDILTCYDEVVELALTKALEDLEEIHGVSEKLVKYTKATVVSAIENDCFKD